MVDAIHKIQIADKFTYKIVCFQGKCQQCLVNTIQDDLHLSYLSMVCAKQSYKVLIIFGR